MINTTRSKTFYPEQCTMVSRFVVGLCVAFLACPGIVRGKNEKKNLTIGGLYASGAVTTFQNASGILKTVNKAIQYINGREDLLPGYHLNIVWHDTKCQLGRGIQALFKHVNEPPTKIMLLGGICSAATRPIAECSQLMNLVQVSYGASTFYLSNKQNYPLFFRTVPPEMSHDLGRLELLRHFKWNRVAILAEREHYYEAAFTSLVKLLENSNISIVAQEFLADENDSNDDEHIKWPLKSLKEKDARVVIGLFSESKAVEVFCQAYKQGFYGDRYAWMLLAWYQMRWWETHSARVSHLGCTKEQVLEASGNYISTGFLNSEPRSSEEAYEGWKENVDKLGYFSGFAFDAIMAMVLALNDSAQILASENKSLLDFTYKNKEMAQIIKDSLSKVSFKGVSGRVYFNKHGEREGIITISQMQGGEVRILGNYTVVEYKLVLESSKFVWGGGRIPLDHVSTVDRMNVISLVLFGFFCTAEVLGIFMAVGFLAFNISHSDHRYIKMSSPRMNNIIVVGAILIYISGILRGLDGKFLSIKVEAILRCRFSNWVGCVGFTLGFGGMFLKTWRVHKIFVNRTKRMVISDFQLIAMVGLFLSFDFLILIIWEIVDSMHEAKYYTGNKVYDSTTDTYYKPYYIVCTSSYPTVWKCAIYAYKGLLLVFGAFMAWETRSVTVPALNDSRYIGISVYNVLFPCALGITVINIVEYNPDVSYVVISVLVVFCTTITLCLVFIPKITTVKKDPLGKNKPRFVSNLNSNLTTQINEDERVSLRPKSKPQPKSTQDDGQRASSSLI